MDLKSFQKSFKNLDINLRPYLIVVSVFISIIFIIIFFNNKIEDYYVTSGTVKDNKVIIIVDINNLKNIVNNKKIKIENNIFTYKIEKIDDYVLGNDIYKQVTIKINKFSNNLIDNNVIEIKIIINKTNIFNYLVKTLKGE